MNKITEYFESISDPRIARSQKHNFLDILMISLCSILAGADGWEAIYDFGTSKEPWLRTFLKLEHGIPCPDTFRRVISRINPLEFENSFTAWVTDTVGKVKGLISIDGKTVKNKRTKNPLHLVSAWTNQNNGFCLAQVATAEKSNEITAIPTLLEALDIKGCMISIDAIGCQKKIAQTIIEKEGEYCLAVKNNHPKLYQKIVEYFSECDGSLMGNVKQTRTDSKGHGRKEIRIGYLSNRIKSIEELSDWPGIKQFGMIYSVRKEKEKTTIEKRYYILSKNIGAKEFINITREHWAIENKLHWVLDVTFEEDGNRIYKDHGQQNLAILRKISINLLNKEKSKISKKRRIFKLAMDSDYMSKVLALM